MTSKASLKVNSLHQRYPWPFPQGRSSGPADSENSSSSSCTKHMVVYTWPRPCFPRQLVREPTACLFQQSLGFPWPDDWGPSMHCKLKTASKSSWGWSEDTLTSSQHLSILFKIHVIPRVSNYLDPVVFLNPQRGRRTMKIWKTSLYYSLVFATKVDGSLFYLVFKLLPQLLAGSAVDRDES